MCTQITMVHVCAFVVYYMYIYLATSSTILTIPSQGHETTYSYGEYYAEQCHSTKLMYNNIIKR